MRRFSTVAFLLLASSAAFAARHPGAVRIGAPTKVFVPHEQVASICGASRPVDACTRFDELLLTCNCEQTATGWNTRSRFSATTSVVLAEPSLLLHELSHVQDFRSMIAGHLERADAVTYSSSFECEEASRQLQAAFASKLDEIRRASAYRRDHTAVAGTVRMRLDSTRIDPARLDPARLDPALTGGAGGGGGAEIGRMTAADEVLQPHLAPMAP